MNWEFNGYYLGTRSGVIDDTTEFYTWNLLRSFTDKDVYWHSREWQTNDDLPQGHRAYIVKVEGADLEWLEQQAGRISAPIFVLNGIINDYGAVDHIPNVTWLPWIEWHYQIQSMLRDYPADVKKNIKKKVSCLSNMVKPNRMIAAAAVDAYVGQDAMITWHGRCYREGDDTEPMTGHPEYDQWLARYYETTQLGTQIDDFQVNIANDHMFQRLIHDFHFAAYQECAINVTNESFYRSGQHIGGQDVINPGPFLTEKTLKCLMGETAFVANGNFQTYSTLKALGFEFDYGLDLSYDEISGDLERLCRMTDLLKTISTIDTQDLFQYTRSSCLANKEHIMSGKFFDVCEDINERTIQQIHNSI